MMHSRPYVVCFTDTETTGLNFREEKIIQLAMMKIRYNPSDPLDIQLVSSMEAKLEIDPSRVSREAAELNGYDPDVWAKEAKDRRFVMKQYLTHLEWSQFGGQNPKFDWLFIDQELQELKLAWPKLLGYTLWAVEMLALPLRLSGYIQNAKQETLCDFFKLGKQTHEALDDVRQSVRINQRLLSINIKGISEESIQDAVDMEDPKFLLNEE